MRDTSIRESLSEKQWNRIFYGCPGAWAGNKPQPNQAGSIVIAQSQPAARAFRQSTVA